MSMPSLASFCALLSLLIVHCQSDETTQSAGTEVKFTWDTSLKMEAGENKSLNFKSDDTLKCGVTLFLKTAHIHCHSCSMPVSMAEKVEFKANTSKESLNVKGLHVGQTILRVNGTDAECSDIIPDIGKNSTRPKIAIYVVHSYAITILSEVIGWIYFVAWSISFYPQVYLNFKRKSVVGLNFDFLALNITGFLAYAIYNVALYCIPKIQELYGQNHPDGVNPVQLNDVVFAVHAVALTAITIIQAVIYETAGQRVSRIAIGILSVIGVGMFVLLFVAVGQKISWLMYVNVLSYVKLGITLIKYVPQALMNYRRKSTVGWSIGNVLLDFTGGAFSILQMILQSYNNDEWDLVFGDPTKFGLGFFSVLFDILFMVQHYILYNPKQRKMLSSEPLLGSDSDGD